MDTTAEWVSKNDFIMIKTEKKGKKGCELTASRSCLFLATLSFIKFAITKCFKEQPFSPKLKTTEHHLFFLFFFPILYCQELLIVIYDLGGGSLIHVVLYIYIFF